MTNLEEWKRIDLHDIVYFKDQHYEVIRKDIRKIEPQETLIPVLYLRPVGGEDGIVVTISEDGLFSQLIWDGKPNLFSDPDKPCDSSGYELCSPEKIKGTLPLKYDV
ncbi:hypothetical protein KAU33_09045 [Candidatus Dependentiae bacterium]|nr:hypothetical protein [Candidatus Dependentiae bacterium]